MALPFTQDGTGKWLNIYRIKRKTFGGLTSKGLFPA